MFLLIIAEEVGFEPTRDFCPYRVSSAAPSTTQPLFHIFHFVQMEVANAKRGFLVAALASLVEKIKAV